MNPTPRLNWNGYIGEAAPNTGCGLLAMENTAIAFWQSLGTLVGRRAEPFIPTDIPKLAREIRQHYNKV